MKRSDEHPIVQVCVICETGDIIVQVFKYRAILTIRQPEQERLAEIELTEAQATAVTDLLGQITSPDSEDS